MKSIGKRKSRPRRSFTPDFDWTVRRRGGFWEPTSVTTVSSGPTSNNQELENALYGRG